MRTTVTLEPDVEVLLRQRMRERGLTFKAALNQALRSALTAGSTPRARRYRQVTYRMGFRPEMALDKALALAAADEDEELARKLSMRK